MKSTSELKDMKIIEKVIMQINKLDRENKIRLVFNLNNGIMLEEKLRVATNTDYEFCLEDEIYGLKFRGPNKEEVVLNSRGEIIKSADIVSEKFANDAKDRLSKTNEMLKKMGY